MTSSLTFHSQQNEDATLYEMFFKNHRNCVFLEMGAMDGKKWSNTKFFEDTLGWTGILIEPLPRYFKDLVQNRPSCITVNCAVSSVEGQVEFLGNNACAGMTHTMADSFRQQHWSHRSDIHPFHVPSRPLHAILHENNIREIHLFSLDVEGGELDVLRTFDWSIPVHVFLIEMDKHNPTKNEEGRRLLRQHGYKFSMRIGNNDVFYHPDRISPLR